MMGFIMSNEKMIHLVTTMGGHQTPYEDIIYAKISTMSDEYARAKIGRTSKTQILAKGPYNGGSTTISFNEVVDKAQLVKLPEDDIAINPHIPLEIDTFDPDEDPSYHKAFNFLVYNGTHPETGKPMRPIRVPIKTSAKDALKALPKAKMRKRDDSSPII